MNNLAQKKKTKQQNQQRSNVIAFPNSNQKAESFIAPVPYATEENLFTMTMVGDSLSHFGIFADDILIINQHSEWASLRGMNLCVFRINGKKFSRVFVRTDNGHIAVMFNFGVHKFFDPADVELLGVVVSFQRNFQMNGLGVSE